MVSTGLTRILAQPARFIICRSVMERNRICFIDTLATPAPGEAVAVPLGGGLTVHVEPFCGQVILGVIRLAQAASANQPFINALLLLPCINLSP